MRHLYLNSIVSHRSLKLLDPSECTLDGISDSIAIEFDLGAVKIKFAVDSDICRSW
jgi:hypothetical protein